MIPENLQKELLWQKEGFEMYLEIIYMIWLRDIKRFYRDKTHLLSSLARPLLWLFTMGYGLKSSFIGFGGINYTQFIFPGIITMAILFTSMHSAITIVWDREFGFLKEILVAPISRTSIVAGKTISGSTLALLEGTIVLILAPFVGVKLTLLIVLKVMVLMFLISFAFTSFGILIASRMTTAEGFGSIMNFVVMPIFFLSGSMFPITKLPSWLSTFVKIDPLTYGVDILRHIMLGTNQFPVILSLSVLITFSVITSILAIINFNRS
ncbi:MAG: ABC transporter permease [Candidatus Firestonebacteria bacterium]